MNNSQFSKHLIHYLPLLGVFLAGFSAFFVFSHNQVFQIAIVILVACLYVVWGIIHHLIHKDLYLTVVIEYLAVAVLGLVIVFSLIFNR